MNPESLPTSPLEAQTGVEKRREVAEDIRRLFESAAEAATKLIQDQGGVSIRDKIVSLKQGKEGADVWFTETHLILEALEQKKVAAEERASTSEGKERELELEAAQQYALAQEFFEHYHGSVATYLDALERYPETAALMENVHSDFPERLAQAQESYAQ